MIRTKIWAAVWLILGWTSCDDQKERRTESTLDLVGELAQFKLQARQSTNYPYFTDELLTKLEVSLKGMPYTMKSGQWLDYVLVLLLKGDNLKCIDVIDGYLAGNGIDTITDQSVSFYKVKALAHLRHGEITNCIQNHAAQSCIMPMKGGGIHQITDPVREAIKVYEQLLAFDALDYQSRWMLNLCHMAIGQYPQQVLPEFLIPPAAFQSDTLFPVFKNISMELGVATNNHAGGASIEDFNNDGYLDIFTTSYSLAEQSRLYLNDGQGQFLDRTEQYGLIGQVGGLNDIHADFNNDGFTDIYIMRGAWLANNGRIPNSLLINQQDRFADDTKRAGVYNKMPTGSVAAADFNLDGHLDLFVGNESSQRQVFPSQLYANNGDGTFTNVAPELGMEIKQYVKGAVWGDVNNDGWPDLYLSLYGGANRLYINREGTDDSERVFEDVALKAGVRQPVMSFTSWFWDYNQDGLQDLMVFGYDNRESYLIADEVAKDYLGQKFKGELPRLFKNNGDETFSDVTAEVGLDKLLYVMGGNFGDLNNDGYPDMYLGTGEFNIWATVPNRAFLNIGGQYFADVTTAGEFGQIQKGHGVAFGDLDNDGDQDIYHQVGGAAESDVFQNMLFENPGFDHHWVSLTLQGVSANRSAIGARIQVEVLHQDGSTQTIHHQVGTGGSFGANALRAEIGLGQASQIKQIEINWPDKDGSVQIFTDIQVDRFYRLIQDQKEPIMISSNKISFIKSSDHEHHH